MLKRNSSSCVSGVISEINDLPFKLTKAQLRVLEEIDKDMESEKAMNRLLQGDVGSGKTIVAIIAAYKAVKSGYQMAIMAPTSILATQHLESFEAVLSKYGSLLNNVELYTSFHSKKFNNPSQKSNTSPSK